MIYIVQLELKGNRMLNAVMSCVNFVAWSMLMLGAGMVWLNGRSLAQWLWTWSRPTSEKPFEWVTEQCYRGEMSPPLAVTHLEGGTLVEHKVLPPHVQLYTRSVIKEGIGQSLWLIGFGILATLVGAAYIRFFGYLPGRGFGVLLLLSGFLTWLFFKMLVVEHDPERPLRHVLLGLSSGGRFALILGFICLIY